jgi:hypothetical protein
MNPPLQSLPFALQLVTFPAEGLHLAFEVSLFPLRVVPLATQPFNLSALSFELPDQVLARHGPPARLHALVMPEPDPKYKRNLARSRRSDGELRVTTR